MGSKNYTLRLKIFDLLINEGLFQKSIAQKLRISKQRVSKIVKELINGKYIENAYPESTESYYKTRESSQIPAINIISNRFKCYKRGPNSHIFDEMLENGKITIEKPNIRPHHDLYKFYILAKAQDAKPISDNWKPGWQQKPHLIYHKECEIDFVNYGKIKLRWTTTYNSKKKTKTETVTLNLPATHYYYDANDAERDRHDKVWSIWQWFMKKGYSISTPTICRKAHYGIDTGIEGKNFGKYELDKETGTSIDASPGRMEVDSEDKFTSNTFKDFIKYAPQIPNKLAHIDQNIESLRHEIYNGNQKFIEILKEVRDGINSGIDKLVEERKKNNVYQPKKSKEEGYEYQ